MRALAQESSLQYVIVPPLMEQPNFLEQLNNEIALRQIPLFGQTMVRFLASLQMKTCQMHALSFLVRLTHVSTGVALRRFKASSRLLLTEPLLLP